MQHIKEYASFQRDLDWSEIPIEERVKLLKYYLSTVYSVRAVNEYGIYIINADIMEFLDSPKCHFDILTNDRFTDNSLYKNKNYIRRVINYLKGLGAKKIEALDLELTKPNGYYWNSYASDYININEREVHCSSLSFITSNPDIEDALENSNILREINYYYRFFVSKKENSIYEISLYFYEE